MIKCILCLPFKHIVYHTFSKWSYCNQVKQFWSQYKPTYLYPTVLRDYCKLDYFIAECPFGSVVLMVEAWYGRLELGTCLTIDIGYMDCSRYARILQLFLEISVSPVTLSCFQMYVLCTFSRSDALIIMDRFCSGQQSCRVKVNQLEEFISPCPSDMASYLQARYICREGAWAF